MKPFSNAVRRTVLAACAGATLLLASAGAFAQATWPSKPVKLVVPFAPGGTTDLLARILAADLYRAFGQPFVVDNRSGSGGNLGADFVAKSPADGYTLIMGTVGTHSINKALFEKLPYDPQKDFAPITLVASVPDVMVMSAERAQTLRIHSVPDFIRHARTYPGSLNMASSGNGTSVHLAGMLLSARTGLIMMHIPYRGSAPAMTDVLSGHTDVMFDNLPSALPHIRSGRLKAFAVTTAQRSPLLPDLPTLAEAADLKGFDARAWFGLLAPAGTPPDIVNRLQQETAKALASPAMKEKLAAIGAIGGGNTPQQFARMIDEEHLKWAGAVWSSKAKVD